MRAIILAAGIGERLRPHTLRSAKPALPFLNLPLICFPWFHLQRVGVTTLVVNTHHCPETLKAAAAVIGCPNTSFTFESPQILGSGGGIMNAESLLRGEQSFLVANGDEVLLAPTGLTELWQQHAREKNLATLLVCEHPEVGSKFGGVWCDPQGRVHGFGKAAPSGGLRGLHFTGFMALSDRVFAFLPKGQPSNILYDGLVAGLAAGERVACTLTDNNWYETGSEQDFLAATKQCLLHLFGGDEQGRFLEQLFYHYGRVLFPQNSQLIVGKDCAVDPSARFEGPCLLGNGVTVGSNVTIKKYAVIGDATTVAEGCVLDQTVLGRNLSLSARTTLSQVLRLA